MHVCVNMSITSRVWSVNREYKHDAQQFVIMGCEFKRVVLVGGSGFLGLHLIEAFWNLEPRPEIHVIDIRELPDIPKCLTFDKSAITVHNANITVKHEITAVLDNVQPEVVVHSASPIHGLGPQVYHQVNVVGTQKLLEACTEHKSVKAFVYTSSSGVVFCGDDLYGVNEEMPFPAKAMDAYNETKQLGEELVLKSNCPDLKTIALRPAGIFGPGDRQMIPNLKLVAQRNQHRVQLGANNNLFDVTYVGNVAHSHVLGANALCGPEADKVAGQAFFITNDEPIFFWSFARVIYASEGKYDMPKIVIPLKLAVGLGYLSQWVCKLIGKDPSFTAFRVRTACATRYYDITKAKTLLNYKPKWTLEEAVAVTLANE